MNNKNYLLGLDVGSSSIKTALVDLDTGKADATAHAPETEMQIFSFKPGYAEQNPDCWWEFAKEAIEKLFLGVAKKKDIKAIGISYQMHGLVILDKNNEVLRPSIIWCDSRAAGIGDEAFDKIGEEYCMNNLLNSPGNFTASKLAWVKNNEPGKYAEINKMMLPGDYIAYMLSGEISTTISGLSEGILWDFKKHEVSKELTSYYGIDKNLIPDLVPTLGLQAKVSRKCAEETGLPEGIPISYRAGDQPNNALSLNVFNPGELAATAGTSGVIYGILDSLNPDKQARVNLFAHVNHTKEVPRLGVLLCINGTGILYSWLKNHLFGSSISYPEMNDLAATVEPGSDGLQIYPFGNGVERIFQNRPFGGMLKNVDFNRHSRAHIIRAAQEGIIYALNYGFEAMRELGVKTKTVRAGDANMFQSKLFGEIFASLTGTTVELYNTDGAIGAARGAGIGAGLYAGPEEAFSTLETIKTIYPDEKISNKYSELYESWRSGLDKQLSNQ